MRSLLFRAVAPAVVAAALLLPAPGHAEEIVAKGAFRGASGHTTLGDVVVVKSAMGAQVVLQDNFRLDGAPDPKVGFGADGRYDRASQLAHLKSLGGEQAYDVPASLDLSRYNQVYIWCEQFSVPLGVANLK